MLHMLWALANLFWYGYPWSSSQGSNFRVRSKPAKRTWDVLLEIVSLEVVSQTMKHKITLAFTYLFQTFRCTAELRYLLGDLREKVSR